MAKILIVEDEAIIAMDIEYQLKRLGHTVVGIASRGEDAINLAAQSAPDVILMDVRLKGTLDGIETAILILERQTVEIFFLTAFKDEATLQRMQQIRHAGHMVKPVRPEMVHEAIQKVLRN